MMILALAIGLIVGFVLGAIVAMHWLHWVLSGR